MAAISADLKAYIVQRVACFDYPKVVVEAVLQDFGVKITPQDVERHDPTKVSGKTLAKRWVALFWESREKFLEDTSTISISHKSVRLRRLERMAAKAEEMGNMALAATLTEQAAKEMGEAYTNRQKHEHSSPDGTMTPAPGNVTIDPSKLSTGALKELIQATRESTGDKP